MIFPLQFPPHNWQDDLRNEIQLDIGLIYGPSTRKQTNLKQSLLDLIQNVSSEAADKIKNESLITIAETAFNSAFALSMAHARDLRITRIVQLNSKHETLSDQDYDQEIQSIAQELALINHWEQNPSYWILIKIEMIRTFVIPPKQSRLGSSITTNNDNIL